MKAESFEPVAPSAFSSYKETGGRDPGYLFDP